MHCLDKLVKTIKPKQSKKNLTHAMSLVVVASIAGAATIFLTKCLCNTPAKDKDEGVNNMKAEIKQTLEKVDDASIGAVGMAIEKALED